MRLRGGSALRLASAKAWLHRFTFVLLFGATLALMVIGKSDSSLVERARLLATDASDPDHGRHLAGPWPPFAKPMTMHGNS